MIKYTSIAPIRLEAFGDNYEQIFNGAPNLVYVAVRHSAIIPGYNYRLRLYVDEIPVLQDDAVKGFVTYSTRPNIITLDTGKPIIGTWYAMNETNTYTILNIILGHEI